jgi:hypothetical protein
MTVIVNWNNNQLQSIQIGPDRMICIDTPRGSLELYNNALREVGAAIVRDDEGVAVFEVTPAQSHSVMGILCGWPQ